MIIGAGGHGRVVLEIACLMDKWSEIVFLDDGKVGEEVDGYKVIGKIEDYKRLKDEFQCAFVALGDNMLRMKLINELEKEGFLLPTLIHPFSCISKGAEIEKGTVVVAGAVINTGVKIGVGCIINTSSSVDHDCIIQDGVHISPGVNLGGMVRVGRDTWIGIGSTVIHGIDIGKNVIVAGGAAVINDVCDNLIVAKVPAVTVKKVKIKNSDS